MFNHSPHFQYILQIISLTTIYPSNSKVFTPTAHVIPNANNLPTSLHIKSSTNQACLAFTRFPADPIKRTKQKPVNVQRESFMSFVFFFWYQSNLIEMSDGHCHNQRQRQTDHKYPQWCCYRNLRSPRTKLINQLAMSSLKVMHLISWQHILSEIITGL